MRVAEEKIIKAIEDLYKEGKNGDSKKLSCRDKVRIENAVIIYSLWNTDIFRLECFTGKKEVLFSTNKYAKDSAWRENWYSHYRDYSPCSNTTKSRINVLAYYFAHKSFCQRNYELYDGYSKDSNKIPLNKWFEL